MEISQNLERFIFYLGLTVRRSDDFVNKFPIFCLNHFYGNRRVRQQGFLVFKYYVTCLASVHDLEIRERKLLANYSNLSGNYCYSVVKRRKPTLVGSGGDGFSNFVIYGVSAEKVSDVLVEE